MTIPDQDEWTIDSWRLEPRWHPLDVEEPIQDTAPPFWKDLTLAAIMAALLWVMAATLLG